jgi:hypothetical protein
MTTDRQDDVEDLIAALRDDLPSRDDERRIHARLLAGGMAVGSLTVAQLGSAAAASNIAASSTGASGTVVASGAAGTIGAAESLSIAAGTASAQGLAAVFGKAALVTALALGAGYPVVSQLLPPAAPTAATAAVVESKAEGATKPVVPERRIEAPRAQNHAQTPPVAFAAEAPQLQVSSSSARRSEARAALPAPGIPAPASTLEAETMLVERALRAARTGDDDEARRWLSEHQSRYPNGALAPERQRALEQLRRQ